MPVTPAMLEREPNLVRLLEVLQALPRFDASKKASELQGDIPAVREAERLYHSFNTRYQARTTVEDRNGEPKSVAIRGPLLLELFKLADWQNFQRLIQHSTVGRARKRIANRKHRTKQRQGNPKTWFEGCQRQRRARLREWEEANRPRLLRAMAEAETEEPNDTRERLKYEVLNELQAKYVDEYRAGLEFQQLRWRVLLGLYTAKGSVAIHRRLEKLAQELWEDPAARLQKDLAKRLPPIITDWEALEHAMLQSLPANGEIS